MREAQISIHRLTPQEADAVSALARVVWQATYPPLISQAQIDAMLADRYAPARILEQLDDPRHAWWVPGPSLTRAHPCAPPGDAHPQGFHTNRRDVRT